jgi:osmotically inducible protein OsmC
LATGTGHAEMQSGAGGNIPVMCALEELSPTGKASPEEFLAAAHATCFAMALTQALMMAHRKPEMVKVRVTTTLDQVPSGMYMITREDLDIRAKVDGLDEAGFLAAVEAAKPMCAVGLAISGNVEINYQAQLES